LSEKQKDPVTKKIVKMYKNYGLDVNSMSDEEFNRMREMYQKQKADIDEDLEKSEVYSEEFSEKII
jgi:hypothetical protein